MNYRHSYHAGSFTDVFKHVVLIALTKAFLRKETPFCYLDTHAGIGLYDLMSPETQKTKE
jgi:23S rRNA (adenine2030-N6)-methyltransferase